MYLFARTSVVNPGSARAAIATAVEAGSRAGAIIGRPVFTWTSMFGPMPLSVMWSTRFDHLADAVTADDALAADGDFMDWVDQQAGLFAGPAVDTMSEVLHGAPTGEPAPFIGVTRATCANGAIAEAMGLGVEICDTASRVTGLPMMFARSVTGDYAGVGWLVGADDLGKMEDAEAALAASDEWIKLVDRAGHAFAPGTTTMMLRRIG